MQVRFHLVELTLGQENVYIRLSCPWGPNRKLFQEKEGFAGEKKIKIKLLIYNEDSFIFIE